MTIDLTWATAEVVAGELDAARSVLEESAGSAPAAVDAGDATAMVTALIGRLAEGAAGLSEGLAVAGANVRAATGSLLDADLAAGQSFAGPGGL